MCGKGLPTGPLIGKSIQQMDAWGPANLIYQFLMQQYICRVPRCCRGKISANVVIELLAQGSEKQLGLGGPERLWLRGEKKSACPTGWMQAEPGDTHPFGGSRSLSPYSTSSKAGAAWKHRANPTGTAPVSPALATVTKRQGGRWAGLGVTRAGTAPRLEQAPAEGIEQPKGLVRLLWGGRRDGKGWRWRWGTRVWGAPLLRSFAQPQTPRAGGRGSCYQDHRDIPAASPSPHPPSAPYSEREEKGW